MSTSLSDLFNVQISSTSPGISEVGFGTPLILGSTGFGASPDLIRTYNSITEVLGDFVDTSPEYKAAASLEDQNPGVTQFKIGKRAAAVAQVDTVSIATLIASHDYIIQINGVAYSYTTAPSGDTLATIAAALLAAIQAGADASYVAASATSTSFTLTATAAGLGFSVIIEDVALVDVHTIANHGVADDLAAIQAVDDDWYLLILTSRLDADILNAAAYIETQMKLFDACSGSANVLNGVSGNVLELLHALKYNRTFFLYSAGQATYPEAAWAATSHFTPGEENWAYQTAAGSVADKLSSTQRQYIRNKNGNTYEDYGGEDVFLFGKVVSGEYIDVIRLRDWTVSQIQERLFNASVNAARSNGKIPYDDDGGTIYHGIILGVLVDGVNNNGYVKGSPVVTVPLVASQSQANRSARKMAGITFSANLASAVNTGTINGTVTV